MASRNYIWLNGQFFDGGNPVINFGNRAFRYGDGVFETIHAFGTQPRHLPLHFRRLLQGMKILELVAPTWLTRAKP
jgi:Branched-chain amino acid aminotransferase/4-amino-4-deoxychorismate lyase